MLIVKIANQFTAWRKAARQLLHEKINPVDITWQVLHPIQFDWLNDSQPQKTHFQNKNLKEKNQQKNLSDIFETFEILGLNKEKSNFNKRYQTHLFEGDDKNSANKDTDININLNTDLTTQTSPTSNTPLTQDDAIYLPKKVMHMLQTAARTADDDRWAFLYRVLWRYVNGEHDAVLPGDIDGSLLNKRIKLIHREIHYWQAFLRFKKTSLQLSTNNQPATINNLDTENHIYMTDNTLASHDNNEIWIAWCEFENYIIEPIANYFLNRMGQARWLIVAPTGLAFFDGKRLNIDFKRYTKPSSITDPIETLWRTYFSSTFNPSRSNPKLTKKHLPVRFWKHLPEGDLIPSLVAQAANTSQSHAQAQALHNISGSTVDVSASQAYPNRKPSSDLNECRRCGLWENATQAVAGVGPDSAKLILVGEQPGDSEDLSGLPFVGPAGQVLNKALIAADIKHDEVYMTNAVKHFKWQASGQRRLHKTPAQSEINACRFWLDKELQRFPNTSVVTLGATALKSIMQKTITLSSVLNQPFQHEGRWIIATYHPSYILRVPDTKLQQEAELALITGLKLAREISQN